MIPPEPFDLPVFSNLHFILVSVHFLIFEILLTNGYATWSTSCICESILTFGNKLMTFVLPQDGSSIITSGGEESTN